MARFVTLPGFNQGEEFAIVADKVCAVMQNYNSTYDKELQAHVQTPNGTILFVGDAEFYTDMKRDDVVAVLESACVPERITVNLTDKPKAASGLPGFKFEEGQHVAIVWEGNEAHGHNGKVVGRYHGDVMQPMYRVRLLTGPYALMNPVKMFDEQALQAE